MEVNDPKGNTGRLLRGKRRGEKESEGRLKSTFFAKIGEVRREFKKQHLMILLVYKESLLTFDETNTNSSLPCVFKIFIAGL